MAQALPHPQSKTAAPRSFTSTSMAAHTVTTSYEALTLNMSAILLLVLALNYAYISRQVTIEIPHNLCQYPSNTCEIRAADSIRVVSSDGQGGAEVFLWVNGTNKDDFTVCLRHKLKMVIPNVEEGFMIIRDL